MKMSRLCLFVLIACVNSYVAGQGVSSSAYLEHEIIPDVLSVVPAGYLTVLHPSGAEIQEGNVLTPTEVKDIPSVSWDAYSDQFYTVAMADPDAPSRESPTSRKWLHWIVCNIPGTDIDSGETIAEYVGAGPSRYSDLHRYVFLVYQQPSKLDFDEPRLTNRSAENRELLSIGNFAEKYSLGDPIAGNFYQAEWDEYVPIFYNIIGANPVRATWPLGEDS